MIMCVCPCPEVLGVQGGVQEITGETIMSLIEKGYDIRVVRRKHVPPEYEYIIQVSPAEREFE